MYIQTSLPQLSSPSIVWLAYSLPDFAVWVYMCLFVQNLSWNYFFSQIIACWSCALLSGVRTVPLLVGVACPRAGSLALSAPLYRPSRLPVTAQCCARSLLVSLNARSLKWKQRKLFGRPAGDPDYSRMFNCFIITILLLCTKSVISRNKILLTYLLTYSSPGCNSPLPGNMVWI